MFKLSVTSLLIAIGTTVILILLILICAYPTINYQKDCQAYCDSLEKRQNFKLVTVSQSSEPTNMRGLVYFKYDILISSKLKSIGESRSFAKGFYDNVRLVGILSKINVSYVQIHYCLTLNMKK